LVSVLIPAYNHEKYIETCLESLIQKNSSRWEIVIIDDGSQDSTFRIAKAWLEEKQSSFHSARVLSQNNIGIVKTLNRLIGLAQGDYIVLLASDDYLLPGGIDIRLDALEQHPEWLGIFADCVVVNDHGEIISKSGISRMYTPRNSAEKRALQHPDLIAMELILRWSVPGPVFMARREAYQADTGVGLYDERLTAEDRDFYLRLLAMRALGFIDAKVAAYRVHKLSAVKRPNYKWKVAHSVMESERQNIRNFCGLEKMALRIMANRSEHLLKCHTAGGVRKAYYYAKQKLNSSILLFFLQYQKIRTQLLT